MTNVVSEFYGMTVLMSLDSLRPEPHFNVLYEGNISIFDVNTGRLIEGNLDRDGQEIINDWWTRNMIHLRNNWSLLKQNQTLLRVPPIE